MAPGVFLRLAEINAQAGDGMGGEGGLQRGCECCRIEGAGRDQVELCGGFFGSHAGVMTPLNGI